MRLLDGFRRLLPRPSRPKVFCIGYNKTGTTTMEKVLRDLGYRLPRQSDQEKRVVEELYKGNFRPLKKLCQRYEAFQDRPFSQGVTYANVDAMFPSSKFILTVRESEAWFESLVGFHRGGILRKAGIVEVEDFNEQTLKDKDVYLYKNYMYHAAKRHAGIVIGYNMNYDWSLVYDRNHRIAEYEARNRGVIEYFQDRRDQLLVIDVSQEGDTSKIVDFLEMSRDNVREMPHTNRSTR